MSSKGKKKQVPTWLNFVIGGTAGMMATSIVQPMDLLKTRMQLLGAEDKNRSLFQVAKEIRKSERLVGFYTGLSAALFRQATYTTGRLGVFNALFDIHQNKYGVPSFPMKVFLGMVAGSIGAFVGTPAEVALIRMTADGRMPVEKRRNYTNVFNALARSELLPTLVNEYFTPTAENALVLYRIIKEEGVATLWRGTSVTVSRAVVVNGAQLSSYTQARQLMAPYLPEGITLHFTAAMTAGFITSLCSVPVDIVKTRVQNAVTSSSMATVLMSVVKNEGVLALWSGLLPTCAKIGPHTVFCFIFLEQLNSLYLNNFEVAGKDGG